MPAIDAQVLFEEAKCYTCFGLSLFQGMELALLSRIAQSGAGGASPGGLNTQIQFNDAGVLGGDDAFTWNKATNVLTVGGSISAGAAGGLTINSTTGGGYTINQSGGGVMEINYDSDFYIQGNGGGDLYLSGDADGVFIGKTQEYNFMGNDLLNNGFKILTTQQAAVADATTAVDVITRFNELLARLRESTGHGLIAG